MRRRRDILLLLSLWIGEHLMSNENLPWNTFLLQLMHHNHFNKRVVKEALHLLRIVSFLYNIGHFVNASVEVIGQVKHPNPSKVHQQNNVIGVMPGEPSLRCKYFMIILIKGAYLSNKCEKGKMDFQLSLYLGFRKGSQQLMSILAYLNPFSPTLGIPVAL